MDTSRSSELTISHLKNCLRKQKNEKVKYASTHSISPDFCQQMSMRIPFERFYNETYKADTDIYLTL